MPTDILKWQLQPVNHGGGRILVAKGTLSVPVDAFRDESEVSRLRLPYTEIPDWGGVDRCRFTQPFTITTSQF